ILTPWKESYDQPRQHIQKQRHYFANKGPSSQGYVFPVVTYGCESWTVKKAEHQRIDAFELWCWRRLLRVPWTAPPFRCACQCALTISWLERSGLPAKTESTSWADLPPYSEDRLVEGLGRGRIGGVQLGPAECAGGRDGGQALVIAELPDGELCAGGIAEAGHRPGVRVAKRREADAAPRLLDSFDGGFRVQRVEVQCPGRTGARLGEWTDGGDRAAADREPAVAPGLRSSALEFPAEHRAVEGGRGRDVRGAQVHPGRGTMYIVGDEHFLDPPARSSGDVPPRAVLPTAGPAWHVPLTATPGPPTRGDPARASPSVADTLAAVTARGEGFSGAAAARTARAELSYAPAELDLRIVNGLRDRAQAVVFAYETGLVRPGEQGPHHRRGERER